MMTLPATRRHDSCTFVLLALACLALAACHAPSGPNDATVSLTMFTDRMEYRPLDQIIVTTTNQGGGVVYDDHYTGGVQGFEYLGRWNGSYGESRACVDFGGAQRAFGIPIPVGTTHVDTFHVNSQSYAGTWRVELGLRDETGALVAEDRRISNTFHVTRP